MSEYIDVRAFKKAWDKYGSLHALNMILDDATMDGEVAPVKHGYWIDMGSGQECSICGERQYGYDNFRRYCAFCGAKMDQVLER